MRKSIFYLMGTALASLILLSFIGIFPRWSHETTTRRLLAEKKLVGRYLLTDICLFTEAPHTRHPNMADRFVPFQNHPSAAAHFPSESFIMPPDHLTRIRPPAAEKTDP